QPVEPFELLLRDLLQIGGGLRDDVDAVLEELEPVRIAEACNERLYDVEIDAAHPHARLGALLRRLADQRAARGFLVEIFADGGDLGEVASVIELETGKLSARIPRQIGLAPVLAAYQVDLDLGQLDAALRHEHADRLGIGTDRSVKLHGAPPRMRPAV